VLREKRQGYACTENVRITRTHYDSDDRGEMNGAGDGALGVRLVDGSSCQISSMGLICISRDHRSENDKQIAIKNQNVDKTRACQVFGMAWQRALVCSFCVGAKGREDARRNHVITLG
jgi:hypothetical protein